MVELMVARKVWMEYCTNDNDGYCCINNNALTTKEGRVGDESDIMTRYKRFQRKVLTSLVVVMVDVKVDPLDAYRVVE